MRGPELQIRHLSVGAPAVMIVSREPHLALKPHDTRLRALLGLHGAEPLARQNGSAGLHWRGDDELGSWLMIDYFDVGAELLDKRCNQLQAQTCLRLPLSTRV
jgi:hypothetical protein